MAPGQSDEFVTADCHAVHDPGVVLAVRGRLHAWDGELLHRWLSRRAGHRRGGTWGAAPASASARSMALAASGVITA